MLQKDDLHCENGGWQDPIRIPSGQFNGKKTLLSVIQKPVPKLKNYLLSSSDIVSAWNPLSVGRMKLIPAAVSSLRGVSTHCLLLDVYPAAHLLCLSD